MSGKADMNFGEFYHLTVGQTFKAKHTSDSPEEYTLYLLVTDAKHAPEDGYNIAIHRIVVLDGGLPSPNFPCGSEIWYDEETTDAEAFFEYWESCEPKEFLLRYYKTHVGISDVVNKHLPLSSISHCGMDAGND